MILLPLFAPPAVRLELRGTTLDRAIPAIGRACGLPMRAAPAIGGEMIVASFRDVEPEDLKARVAETFAAEWTTDRDGTLVLNRSARLRDTERRASLGRRTVMTERGLARVRALLARNAPLTREGLAAAGGRLDQSDDDGPDGMPDPKVRTVEGAEWRLMWRLLAPLQASDAGGLGTRTVYALRPTPRQRALALEAPAFVRLYGEERRAYAELSGQDAPPEAPVTNVLLTSESAEDEVRYRLAAYDASGAELWARGAIVSLEDGSMRRSQEIEGQTAAVAASEPTYDGPKFRFALSPESKEFARVFGTGTGWSAKPRPPLADYRPFLNVTERDPLGYAASDVVLQLARESGRSVLMRGFDRAIVAGEIGEGEREMAPEAALGTRAIDRSRPGWITIRPDDPYVSAETDFPRPALAQALRLGFDAPSFPVGVQIRIANLMPESSRYVPLASMVERLGPVYGVPSLYDTRTLRLLGALGGGETTRTIRVRELGRDAETRLDALIYGIPAWRFRPDANATPIAVTLGKEPTLLLPNGPTPDGELTITREARETILVPMANEEGGRTVFLKDLAELVYQSKHPDLFPYYTQNGANLGGLTRVPLTVVTLRFRPRPGYEAWSSIVSQGRAEGPRFTIDTLPADLRADFDRAMAEVERKYRDAKPEEGGRGVSPP